MSATNFEGQGAYSESSDPVIPASKASAPTGLQLVSRTADSLTLSWMDPLDSGGRAVTEYQVEYSEDGANWHVVEVANSINSQATIPNLQRGLNYQTRVRAITAEGLGDDALLINLVPAVVPGTPAIRILSKSATTVSLQWDLPDNGGLSISDFEIEYSNDYGNHWNQYYGAYTNPDLTMITGLTTETPYQFRVSAVNELGAGAASMPSEVVIPRTQPGAPTSLAMLDSKADRTTSTVSFSWRKVNSEGIITNYIYRTSSNDGATWTEARSTEGGRRILNSETFAYSLTGLSTAQARLVQVAAVNGDGPGPWSDPLMVTTRGARLMRVLVSGMDGSPISGGLITWEMNPRSAWSTKAYGLTADGVIDFPAAPAGNIRISLTNGQLPDGTSVSGSWEARIGFDELHLTIPTAPISSRIIKVTLPNGTGIGNVSVDAGDASLSSQRVIDGFTFSRKISSSTGLTNSSGNFRLTGFLDEDWNSRPSVTATYDDGVITQQQSVTLEDETLIELDYLPWVEATSDTFSGAIGAAIPVTLAVDTADGFFNMRPLRNLASSSVGVSLVAPGVKSGVACGKLGAKSQLSGRTNASGKVTLKVCGLKSGDYTLKTEGAVPVGTVRVHVVGAPSTPVTSVSARSTAAGQVRTSWNAPEYTGGAPVLQYKIQATATGSKTLTIINAAKLNKSGSVITPASAVATFSGLTNATKYTVKIYAITKYGTSDPYIVSVPVA